VGSININVDVSANSGDDIEVSVRLTSELHIGVESITFQTNFTTEILTNDLSVEIDFNELFGNVRQIDFVKDVMQRFGLIYRKVLNTDEFEFKTMKDLLSDKTNVEDWSDKYSGFLNETYKPNYGRDNIARYIYEGNEDSESYADGILTVDNVNLKSEADLFTSIFKATELNGDLYQLNHWKEDEVDDIISYLPNDDGLRTFKINSSSDVLQYRFSENVLLPASYVGTIAYLNFSNVYYQNELDSYYAEINVMLDNYKLMTVEINLSVLDIYKLDFFKLKYIKQLGQYFYLNKVIGFKNNKVTRVELVQVGESILEYGFMSVAVEGDSEASATLVKLGGGEMSVSVEGDSEASASLSLGVTAFDMSNVGQSLEEDACSETADTEHYHDGIGVDPAVNDTIYTDSGGTITKLGNDEYFKISGNRVIKINTSGVVTIKTNCE